MGVPEKMLAYQVTEYKKPHVLNKVAVPNPGPGELLIKVAVASLCHTDFMVQDGVFGSELPITASHEGAGTVAGMGSDLSDWKTGDRVMCPIVAGRCGECVDCKGQESYKHYCPNEGHRGVTKDGAFAEYMLIDASEAVRIPDAVSFAAAAPLACAGRTVYRSIILPDLSPGQTICLVGSGGGLGHIGIQFARALSLRCIALDARDAGISLSTSLGADLVLDARTGKGAVVKAVQDFTGGAGADATVNLSDASSAAALACAVTKMHGTMVQVAQPPDVVIPFQEYVFRDVRVRGSLLSSRREAEDMLELVARGGIEVKKQLFHGLHKVETLIQASKDGKIDGKGLVVVDETAEGIETGKS